MIDIDISRALVHPGKRYAFEWEGSPDLAGVDLLGPLRIEGTYGLFDGAIRVEAALEAQVRLECDRCLSEVRKPVAVELDELLVTDPGDLDVYSYNRETKRISLDQLALDAVTTEIPLQILCRSDCRGLCPECGQNLNEGTCGCAGEEGSIDSANPFAMLKGLFEEQTEEKSPDSDTGQEVE